MGHLGKGGGGLKIHVPKLEHERNEFFRPNYRFYRNSGFVSNESEVRFSKSGFGLIEAEMGFPNSVKNELYYTYYGPNTYEARLLSLNVYKKNCGTIPP